MGFVAELRRRFPSLPLIFTSVYAERAAPWQRAQTYSCQSRWSATPCCGSFAGFTAVRLLCGACLIVDDNEVSRYIVRELLDRPWLALAKQIMARKRFEADAQTIFRTPSSWIS